MPRHDILACQLHRSSYKTPLSFCLAYAQPLWKAKSTEPLVCCIWAFLISDGGSGDFMHLFNYKPPSVTTVRWGRRGCINRINKNSHFHVFIYPKNAHVMRLPYTKAWFSPCDRYPEKNISTWPHEETAAGWFDWQVSGMERLPEKSQRDRDTNARV